jgi:D-alanine-D-alanine ligase
MKTTICVIFGGKSAEHDVSIITGIQAINKLSKDKYNVVPVYISREGVWHSGLKLLNLNAYKNPNSLLNQVDKVYFKPSFGDHTLYFEKKSLLGNKRQIQIDVVIPALHGTYGEDGKIQGLLELIGIPYTGCDTLASAVGMDKIAMKKILAFNKLPLVSHFSFDIREWYTNQNAILEKANSMEYPLIIKPSDLGSSIGVSKANNQNELIEAIDLASQFSNNVIVEKMVKNLLEINCAVVGNKEKATASYCEEPHFEDDVLSYKDKYVSKEGSSEGMGGSKRTIPADIPAEQTKKIQEMAIETFKCLFSEGVARIDFLIDKNDNKIYVNEINTLPGSFAFYLFEPAGKPFATLLEEIIQLAIQRRKRQDGLTTNINVNIFSNDLGSFPKLGKA